MNVDPYYLARAARFHSKRLALGLGLFGGHSDYRRFVILGRGRTGSNFLRGLMNAHSRVVVFGELFRTPDSIGWEFPDYERFRNSRAPVALMQSDPPAFLEREVFRNFPSRTAAVGFKLFYYHARDDRRRRLWAWLKEQKDLRVIHLKRRNTLRMIVSEKKAFRTDTWTNTTGAEESKFSVAIDYEECLRRFQHEQAEAAAHDRFFSGHPMLEVIYEDLASDYRDRTKRILEFLDLDYEPIEPSTYRQSSQPLAETIENYFELKDKFKGTRWEAFFEARTPPAGGAVND